MLDRLFLEIFSKVEDPRMERTKKHLLIDIIGISLCAVIAGALNFVEIADFGRLHKGWFKQYFDLPNGIPSHDTFGRVFSLLNPKAFEKSFQEWLCLLGSRLAETVIAVDGKTLRGSSRSSKGLKGLHIVSAWSCANGISLGQLKVDDKSNEIKAIPKLLEELMLEGSIVTMDAMGCQRELAHQIKHQKADYILAVKSNQGTLYDTTKALVENAKKEAYKSMVYWQYTSEMNGDHGRLESRHCTVFPIMYLHGFKKKWQGAQSVVSIESRREIGKTVATETRYYITSLEGKHNAEKISKAIRSHWEIENKLHWCLDVIFREDESRLREETAAVNLAWLRRMALGLLKKEKDYQTSIRRKQLKAWADPQYLKKIVNLF